jgi:hypothetical protein
MAISRQFHHTTIAATVGSAPSSIMVSSSTKASSSDSRGGIAIDVKCAQLQDESTDQSNRRALFVEDAEVSRGEMYSSNERTNGRINEILNTNPGCEVYIPCEALRLVLNNK